MHVVSIGELVVDWLSLSPGETLLSAQTFHRALGGNATNVAVAVNRLGTKVTLVGKIGNDLHGEYLKHALQAEGLVLDCVITDGAYPTAQCYMTTDGNGDHAYRNWPSPHAAGMLTTEELPIAVLKQADFLHATAVSMAVEPRRTAVQKAIDVVRDNGGIISFDAGLALGPNHQGRPAAESVMEKAHLLKMNEAEVYFWSGNSDKANIEAAAQKVFAQYRPLALLVTQAAKGSFIVRKSGNIHCQPLKINAVSEVGAGDAYIGALLHWLCQNLEGTNRPLAEHLDSLDDNVWRMAKLAANVAGALATLKENAYAGMPGREQLDEGLRRLNSTS